MIKNSKSLVFPLLLVLYEIASYLSNDMYLPALPAMMRDLKLTSSEAQLTLTTWFIGAASTPLVMCAIADRFGRKLTLLLGGVIYMLSTAMCAMTTTLSILLIGRFIQGGMMASMLVPGYAVIHELYKEKEAIKILALMGSISILAPAFGPLLGSVVLLFSDWRWIFWIIAIWVLFVIAMLSYCMPETLTREQRHSLHFKRLFQQYWYVLRNKRFILQMFGLGFIFSGFIVWITAGPLLVIVSFHYSAVDFGIIQALVFAAYILGNRQVKYWIDTMGTKALIQLGLRISLIGGIILFIFDVFSIDSIYTFLIGMILFSFGTALCFAPLNRTIIDASDAPMSIRVALFTSFITGFGVLGSGMASIFYNGTVNSLANLIIIAIGIAWSLIKFSLYLQRNEHG